MQPASHGWQQQQARTALQTPRAVLQTNLRVHRNKLHRYLTVNHLPFVGHMSHLNSNGPVAVSLPPRIDFSAIQAQPDAVDSARPDDAAGQGEDASNAPLLLQAHSARMSGDWSRARTLYASYP